MDVAEDLVQETLLAAVKGADRFKGESSHRTWLIGILRRKIVDYFRRQSRQPSENLDVESLSEEAIFSNRGHLKNVSSWPRDPSMSLEDAEFWGVFEDCNGKLPVTIASAFSLRVVDELGTQEVCKILEISATNLSVRLHRARLLLRECLENHWFKEN